MIVRGKGITVEMFGSAEEREELQSVLQRMVKIKRARELNKSIRSDLLQRVQEINVILLQRANKSVSPLVDSFGRPTYSFPTIWDFDSSSLVNLFWGKKPKHEMTPAQSDEEDTQGDLSAQKHGFSADQRGIALAFGYLTTNQLTVLLNDRGGNFAMSAVDSVRLFPIDFTLTLSDQIRLIVSYRLLSNQKALTYVYPQIPKRRIREFIRDIQRLPHNSILTKYQEDNIRALISKYMA